VIDHVVPHDRCHERPPPTTPVPPTTTPRPKFPIADTHANGEIQVRLANGRDEWEGERKPIYALVLPFAQLTTQNP